MTAGKGKKAKKKEETEGEAMNHSSGWLNAREAALYLGRKSRTAYKTMQFLARAGKIRAGFDGKTWHFRPEDLDSWLYVNAKKVAR
jgi:excisionase family DNA binding protein